MQSSKTSDYGDVRTTKLRFDDALTQIEVALKKEGFGVLCQIDIQAKMKEKLGIDFPRYVDVPLKSLLCKGRVARPEDGVGAISARSWRRYHNVGTAT